MTKSIAYVSAHQILADRTDWAVALLGEGINEGRTRGWVSGDVIALAASSESCANAIAAREEATPHTATALPVTWLAARLELDPAQVAALWLLVCVELDPLVARLAETFGGLGCPGLSIQIVSRLVGIDRKQLARLTALALVIATDDPSVPSHRRAVRAHDRLVELAAGDVELDSRLDTFALLQRPRADGPASPTGLLGPLAMVPAPAIVAVGPVGSGRATLLARAAAEAGLGVLRVDCARCTTPGAGLLGQLSAVFREACLFGVVPLFENVESDGAAHQALRAAATSFAGPIFITAITSLTGFERPSVVHEMKPLDAEARRIMWSAELPGIDEALATAAAEYALHPGALKAAARNARSLVGAGSAVGIEEIHAGVRVHLGERLAGIATRIVVAQDWEDLVIPGDQFDQVLELVARVRRRKQVLDTWGFARKVGKGRGITALMSGPPGTGKTMAAGLVAKELGLDLYQVDLSKVVSKYIGETEKQLGAIFDAAESGHFVLLFDEADSLFGKRSAVKSSNDRYANLEVNYLLQRLEAFNGIAILTTNQETAIDEAFRRRLAIHLRFPMPDDEQRKHLWAAMIPAEAQVEGSFDFRKLGREFAMSGGYIKNAVVRAAYLAADENAAITEDHLFRSARAEYEALGKITFLMAA